MNLHEYQAKELLQKKGLEFPWSFVAHSQNIDQWARELEATSGKLVIKAQVHAGGRGKGNIYDHVDPQQGKVILRGGVQLVDDANEAQKIIKTMLGNYISTAQTGKWAKQINAIYVEKATEIAEEYYLSFFLDNGQPIVMYSVEGGINIEEVAERQPDKINRSAMDIHGGLYDFQCREILFTFGLKPDKEKMDILKILSQAFLDYDSSMLEINPLVLAKNGKILPLDCKFSLDSNAGYRQPQIISMRDKSEEDPLEVRASEYNLNYVKLEGTVGCMVNGAGLAMATMDFVKSLGGEPANFLDVGGGADVNTVANAFRILNEDQNVKIIFINIFGGIVQCDRVANGIMSAMKSIQLKHPLLVRLQGTNATLAREIFQQRREEIPVQFQIVEDLPEAGDFLQDFF